MPTAHQKGIRSENVILSNPAIWLLFRLWRIFFPAVCKTDRRVRSHQRSCCQSMPRCDQSTPRIGPTTIVLIQQDGMLFETLSIKHLAKCFSNTLDLLVAEGKAAG